MSKYLISIWFIDVIFNIFSTFRCSWTPNSFAKYCSNNGDKSFALICFYPINIIADCSIIVVNKSSTITLKWGITAFSNCDKRTRLALYATFKSYNICYFNDEIFISCNYANTFSTSKFKFYYALILSASTNFLTSEGYSKCSSKLSNRRWRSCCIKSLSDAYV